MTGFFRVFLASLLALVIFSLLVFFLLMALVSGLAKSDTPKVEDGSVLVVPLDQFYQEQAVKNSLIGVSSIGEDDVPGLYDVVRLISKAAKDDQIKGIIIKTGFNPNGIAASGEIRSALDQFRKSGKFLIAHGEWMDQRSLQVAAVANKVYLHPQGFMEWKGFSVSLLFLKGLLDKLEIEPQIFYAGKFKSATEIFRTEEMTPENRLQTEVWLQDLYKHYLESIARDRKLDTATLRKLADDAAIQTPADAVKAGLIDGLKYDDELREEFRKLLKKDSSASIPFISINDYARSGNFKSTKGDKIALIYAQGAIIDGSGDQGQIGSETYTRLIRNARKDRSVKAIVLRINSGGGSALASESIWRELELAEKEKPLVVSFGDVAASGGYYIACPADSIFAHPTTLTGSIGVFGIVPNMESFFDSKLGITFDGVKTGPFADAGSLVRPMSEQERNYFQASIDRIYDIFRQRVAEGRNQTKAYVDSIAQGRVWSGYQAEQIKLIDRFGGLEDAIQCAARMAKLKEYRLREYPAVKSFLDRLLGDKEPAMQSSVMRKELGEDYYRVYQQLQRVREMTSGVQARLPFEFKLP